MYGGVAGEAGRPVPLCRLEAKSQTKLDYTWQIVLRRNLAKVRRAETRVRRTELWVVEEVKKLRAEFEPDSIIGAEFSVLEGGKINVLDPVATKVRLCA